MVLGTSGRHPCHCRIAVHARLRRWDEWLLGALRHWHDSAGEGYPPPQEIGRHQPLGCPLDQAPAAAEQIPRLPAMGAANDPHVPLRVHHQPAEGEREADGKGEDDGTPVGAVHAADGAPTVRRIANRGWATPWHAAVMFVALNPDPGVCLPSGSTHVGARQGRGDGGAAGSSSPRTSNH